MQTIVGEIHDLYNANSNATTILTDQSHKLMLSTKIESTIDALSSVLRGLFGQLSSSTLEIFNLLQSLRDTTLGLQEDIRIFEYKFENNCESFKKVFPINGGFRTFIDVTDRALESALDTVKMVHLTFLSQSTNFFQRLNFFSSSPTNLQLTIKEIDSNLQSLARLFPFFISIVSCSGFEKSGESLNLEEAISRITIDPFWYKQHSSLQQFRELLYITYVTLEETAHDPQTSPLVRHLSTLRNAVHNSLDRQKVLEKIKRVHDTMDIHFLKRVWNLPDEPVIAKLTGFSLPSVALSQVFFIQAHESNGLNFNHIKCRIISALTPPFSIQHLSDVTPLPSTTIITHTFSTLPLAPQAEINAVQQPRISVIFHMHGGGFVSGSSQMHENYLREWAKMTDAIIVSVDYSLGPESKFPTSLLECYNAYKWVCEGNLGAKVAKIVIAGDSAGGNLAIGIVLKCVEHNFRVPDGVLLAYPSVDMTATLYPSRLLFVNDPLVPAKAAKLCRDSYLPPHFFQTSDAGSSPLSDPNLLLDPYLSPLYAPDSLLSKFPVTLFALAQYDPLLDEGLLFAEKLNHLERNISVKQYLGLPHGFLSTTAYIPQSVAAVKELGVWLKVQLQIDNVSNVNVNE